MRRRSRRRRSSSSSRSGRRNEGRVEVHKREREGMRERERGREGGREGEREAEGQLGRIFHTPDACQGRKRREEVQNPTGARSKGSKSGCENIQLVR